MNERVKKLGLVEEVGSCDPDGVSRPSGDVGMFGWELVCLLCSKAEEGSFFGSGDVLEMGRSVGYITNPQRESGLPVQVLDATNNAQGCGDRAEGRVGGVAIERDSLTVLFVLLHPPADANGSDGWREGVGYVGDGDFAVLEE